MAGNGTHSDSKAATIVIKDLKFTYPGIDGHPPPGSLPLIQNFSLTLCSGDRCLLVGSNGAGTLSLSLWILRICNWPFFIFAIYRENHDPEDTRREAPGGTWHGSRAWKISFSRHHFGVFWWSLLSRWRGSFLLSFYFYTHLYYFC